MYGRVKLSGPSDPSTGKSTELVDIHYFVTLGPLFHDRRIRQGGDVEPLQYWIKSFIIGKVDKTGTWIIGNDDVYTRPAAFCEGHITFEDDFLKRRPEVRLAEKVELRMMLSGIAHPNNS